MHHHKHVPLLTFGVYKQAAT